MSTIVILRTPHLLLRPWEVSDAEALYTQAHNPIIGKMCGWQPHKSVTESREIIEIVLRKSHSFAICLPNNTPIGSIGLNLQGESNLPVGENEAEIGYWLGEDFWGRGYMTEVSLCIIQYAFDNLHLTQLWASVYKENIASQRVLEKCGFRYHHLLEDFLFPLIGERHTILVYTLNKEK
ncbi:GNAT family N-acetyltransferase [Capnocytophaga sp. oral taxon 338]|uniref:GNAT family N-acetyltransferase n=1 Tax=Capnocytophaga sp. oral taxon 338 TaxID=710239 RepID=UPI000202F495|nr:GNAT family N-acetyltransferase [Capnocytophaga sp. oral taxon 338]EGD35400.1 GNAT family acetyltransferase [Capnocytophaga sp. oral taxon 338 str. F0234]